LWSSVPSPLNYVAYSPAPGIVVAHFSNRDIESLRAESTTMAPQTQDMYHEMRKSGDWLMLAENKFLTFLVSLIVTKLPDDLPWLPEDLLMGLSLDMDEATIGGTLRILAKGEEIAFVSIEAVRAQFMQFVKDREEDQEKKEAEGEVAQ
jgi:hypothetical protein